MKNKSKKGEVVLCWGHILGPCFSDIVLYHIGSILSQMNFNWKLVLKKCNPSTRQNFGIMSLEVSNI